MFRRAVILLALLSLSGPISAQNVVNNGQHADTFIAPAISAVLGTGAATVQVDYSPGSVLDHFTDPAYGFVNVASGLTVNHVPYRVINSSLCCYTSFLD